MTPEADPTSEAAVHLASVQAWRAQIPGADGVTDAVVLALVVDGPPLPPIVVPVEAVAGLAGVLLGAAGVDLGPGGPGDPTAVPVAPPAAADPVGGAAWGPLLAPRATVDGLDRSAVPGGPGVYAWLRDGTPVHLAKAIGRRGLRAAVGGDALRGDPDLGRRPFRASVADRLGLGGGAGTDRLSPAEVEQLDAWIAGCEVAWVATPDPAAAVALEAALRAEHDPARGPVG